MFNKVEEIIYLYRFLASRNAAMPPSTLATVDERDTNQLFPNVNTKIKLPNPTNNHGLMLGGF